MILKMMDECNFRVDNEKYAKENNFIWCLYIRESAYKS